MNSTENEYRLVKLANGTFSVHSVAEAETFHPVVGPVAEAEALYVNQLQLRDRASAQRGEFVIWDVGLGAAANVLTALKATRDCFCSLRIISFDKTLAPLHFALTHSTELGYVFPYETVLQELLRKGKTTFHQRRQTVHWEIHLGDFPTFLQQTHPIPAPHAILFDAFSPAKNPSMWTASLFADLFRHLSPSHPCAMSTYSRSTMLRVTLLLAGFRVGVGHATGEKEETTIAANRPELIAEPLPREWLQRAHKSKSAEPLWEPAYRQAHMSAETWEKLQRHPQFQ
jgi:tRNA U34 5-methylaminomethyl-2-thiouridine-forming methyltransferase MnmC